MDLKKILILLGSLVLVLSFVVSYFLYGFLFLHKISTASTVSGVSLKINNLWSTNEFLNSVGFWQRTTWDKSIPGSVDGRPVKSLKIVFSDKFMWGVKDESDPKDVSSLMEVVNDELILTIQVSATGDEGNRVFQSEFIRALSPYLVYTESDVAKMQDKYKTSVFFKIVR